MDNQITLRIPEKLEKQLEKTAKKKGITKSQAVREAVAAYVTGLPKKDAGATWQSLLPFVGSVELNASGDASAEIARRIRDNNWRD